MHIIETLFIFLLGSFIFMLGPFSFPVHSLLTQIHLYMQVTVEVSNANYKRNTLVLSKTITIPFIVSEKFENCSDLKSCQFENGPCDWTTGDQSKLTTDSMGNKYVLTTIPDQNSKQNIEVMHRVINDSYCGINFLYQTQQGADLTVSVDGLGTLWSTSVEELVDTVTLQTNSSVGWHEVSLYVDVMGVEVMNGRRVVFEGVTGGQVSIDNVTLHPCVDCQAKGTVTINHYSYYNYILKLMKVFYLYMYL